MNCHRCGSTLPPNANACPQCDRMPAKTKRLAETDLNKTRALVQLDRCQNCGFMVFPADTECASCGAWIKRDWQKPVKPAKPASEPRPAASKRTLIGVAVSIVLLTVFVVAMQYFFRLR